MSRHAIPIELRFWPKVEKTETCWNWIGALDGKGYPRIFFEGQPDYARRTAWVISGRPLPYGKHLMNTCRNRKCVKPNHNRLARK